MVKHSGTHSWQNNSAYDISGNMNTFQTYTMNMPTKLQTLFYLKDFFSKYVDYSLLKRSAPERSLTMSV